VDALDLLKTSDVELLHRADACLRQAGSALDTPPSYIDDAVRLRLFLEAHSYLSEILRRRAEKEAAHDRTREHRRFLTELLVIGGLIVVEIVLSVLGLREGRQQAAILEQMNKNTQDTALLIQRAADATTASLEILRQDQAERTKKPRLALYLGAHPVGSATVHLNPEVGGPRDRASFVLSLKNNGDAPATTFRLHALVPTDIVFNGDPFFLVQGYEQSVIPNTHKVTLQLPALPAGQTVRIGSEVIVPKGHAPFKISFTADTMELHTVVSLGSLMVVPPKP
jgi:hypothetical protein